MLSLDVDQLISGTAGAHRLGGEVRSRAAGRTLPERSVVALRTSQTPAAGVSRMAAPSRMPCCMSACMAMPAAGEVEHVM